MHPTEIRENIWNAISTAFVDVRASEGGLLVFGHVRVTHVYLGNSCYMTVRGQNRGQPRATKYYFSPHNPKDAVRTLKALLARIIDLIYTRPVYLLWYA